MPKYTARTVGKVKMLIYPKSTSNSTRPPIDPGLADRLSDIFRSEESEEKRQAILSSKLSWPEVYHLSYGRENLLNWLIESDDPTNSVLEFEGDCGALTGLLARKYKEVVSLESDIQRANIIATRHQRLANLTVIASDTATNWPDAKFDLITATGGLAQSAYNAESDNPVGSLLSIFYSMLTKKGRLVIALENKLGLKYWSGTPEEYTRNYFEGLHDYPSDPTHPLTFSKSELHNLLLQSGFSKIRFYYPFPDHKLPYVIYSDDFYPGKDNIRFPLGLLPSPGNGDREILLSEPHVMRSIEKAGLFPELSNSFLVVAHV